ncbi:phosphatidylinositol-4-phosphate 5-kinase [Cryptosporidium ubiquitum]|uniref:Phosphatidylinositol-4-phosphate 5-kinase n=1 Tax=Cryptosporidium ubiquitum TaxID=857276 RepID=A0A1J4MHS2_9CRYT|nr:phosphatidylinositol-4-phosphate 5-kinase [Cryptosporidium ubiquitum]OII73760.1 phosphatidylinositol-4-phosphate 5-kinase [Cryptosporidium ubiquitum]
MNIRRFRMVLGLLDDGLLSQMIFNAMDIDNNNLLDFYEFGRSLAIMISENFDEKAMFSYRIIKGEDHTDAGDGITFEKLLKSIRAIDNARYMLVGPNILNFSDQEIKNFFNNYSKIKDGENEPKIFFESYKMAIQDSPEFLSFFGIITPNILESYDLDIDSRKPPLIFEGINIFNRATVEKVDYIESIDKELTSKLRLQVFNILEDIKNIKQETTDSLNALEKWILNPKENNLLNCMFFNINGNSKKSGIQNFVGINNLINTFTDDMLSLKNVLNNNIEMLDLIYKRSVCSLQNKVSSQIVPCNSSLNLGTIKKVYNRRKMYINKGNVAPNTKNRMSASEMIKKTFMHKSTSNLDYSRNNYTANTRKRISLIHMYRRKSNISGGFQNMGKASSNIKVKSYETNKLSMKSKHSHLDKESPSVNVINAHMMKRTKGYVVYIGHESWNTVLNMMIGMRLAIGRVYSEPNRNVADYDFIMKEKFFIIPRTQNLSNIKPNIPIQKAIDYKGFVKPVQFIDYNPMVFRKIREICNISPESYVRSVGPEQLLGNMVLGNLSSMNELCSEGKSGAFFYYTTDGRFLIKTVKKKTAVFFRSILNKYFSHIEKNQNSLITRIYGLHALRFKKPLLQPFNTIREQISSNGNSIIRRKSKIHKIFFIVMENIFHTPVEIHRRYDIKGSWVGRSTPLILQEDKTIALKELDMKNNKEMLHIDQKNQIDLLKQLEIDCRFFELYNIMDYSLLIGIHDVQDDSQNIKSLIENKNSRKFVGILSSDQKKVYYLGFIDFFSTWSTIKKFERLYKAIIIGSSNGISAVPPDKYSLRFMKFIKSRISE